MLFGAQKLADLFAEEFEARLGRKEKIGIVVSRKDGPVKNLNKISTGMVGCREDSQSHSENRN